jgi:hypothetical protein
MKRLAAIAALLLLAIASLAAQNSAPLGDITGLYSVVHEGEFVQIEVTDGRVTGVISRFKDEDPEKAQFVDQYFDSAKLEGANFSFRTKALDGISFEFSGVVERGPGKDPSEESYWVIRGRLIERRSASDGKVVEKTHELALKSFPQDAGPEPPAPLKK